MNRLILFITSVLFLSPVYSITIYKATTSDGTTSYSDAHLPGTYHENIIEIPEFDEPEHRVSEDNDMIDDLSGQQHQAAQASQHAKTIHHHGITEHYQSHATNKQQKQEKLTARKKRLMQKRIASALKSAEVNLQRTKRFYQTVKRHQQRNESVNKQDTKYRKKLVSILEKRMHKLSFELQSLKKAQAEAGIVHQAPKTVHKLPLSKQEVLKLNKIFPQDS